MRSENRFAAALPGLERYSFLDISYFRILLFHVFRQMQPSYIHHSITFFFMCVIRCFTREDAYSHWLHLFDFSPRCVWTLIWIWEISLHSALQSLQLHSRNWNGNLLTFIILSHSFSRVSRGCFIGEDAYSNWLYLLALQGALGRLAF